MVGRIPVVISSFFQDKRGGASRPGEPFFVHTLLRLTRRVRPTRSFLKFKRKKKAFGQVSLIKGRIKFGHAQLKFPLDAATAAGLDCAPSTAYRAPRLHATPLVMQQFRFSFFGFSWFFTDPGRRSFS